MTTQQCQQAPIALGLQDCNTNSSSNSLHIAHELWGFIFDGLVPNIECKSSYG